MQVLDLGQLPAQSSAVWAMPLTATQVRWIAAPDLVQHLPYLVAVALSCFVVRWVTQVREET
jgi:hypothetical protein